MIRVYCENAPGEEGNMETKLLRETRSREGGVFQRAGLTRGRLGSWGVNLEKQPRRLWATAPEKQGKQTSETETKKVTVWGSNSHKSQNPQFHQRSALPRHRDLPALIQYCLAQPSPSRLSPRVITQVDRSPPPLSQWPRISIHPKAKGKGSALSWDAEGKFSHTWLRAEPKKFKIGLCWNHNWLPCYQFAFPQAI